jgi:hypothetical protein
MSTQQEFEPTPKWRLKIESENEDYIPLQDWADYHGVIPCLLPMDGRITDTYQVIAEIQNKLDSQPELAETFRIKQTEVSGDGHFFPKVLPFFGVTLMRNTSKGRRYRNPNYLHYETRVRQDPITDTQARLEFFDRYKINPHLRSPWYAMHWGVIPQTARGFINRHRMGIDESRAQAREKIGKTLYTRLVWTDTNVASLVDPLPWGNRSLRRWMNIHGKHSEWKPSERPAKKEWYVGNQ